MCGHASASPGAGAPRPPAPPRLTQPGPRLLQEAAEGGAEEGGEGAAGEAAGVAQQPPPALRVRRQLHCGPVTFDTRPRDARAADRGPGRGRGRGGAAENPRPARAQPAPNPRSAPPGPAPNPRLSAASPLAPWGPEREVMLFSWEMRRKGVFGV